MKTAILAAASLSMVALWPGIAASQGSQERDIIAKGWAQFVTHCVPFLQTPGRLIDTPEDHTPDNWEWFMRFSDPLGYFEYVANPADESVYMNAILSHRGGEAVADCSISLEIPFSYDDAVLYAEIEAYFDEIEVGAFAADQFEFKGDADTIRRTRQNFTYATDFALKLEDVPGLDGIPVYVSAGRLGALFFETAVPSN